MLLFVSVSFAQEKLIFAVLSYGDPIKEYKRYSVFARYLSEKIKKDVDVVIVEDIEKLFQMFKKKEAH
ncbi:MAG: phosphonate ABC transporter substrate-binding protein, partial [Sulfurihydrogenibium azorense]